MPEDDADTTVSGISNPIINSPYEPPQRHFEIGPNGPTGKLLAGRRLSESYIPVPVSRKGRRRAVQEALDFDTTGERREPNTLINDIRREVERWRINNWNGLTPYTRKRRIAESPGDPLGDAMLQFFGRPLGEGEGHNGVGGQAIREQIGDTLGNYLGFARPGGSDNLQMTATMPDSSESVTGQPRYIGVICN